MEHPPQLVLHGRIQEEDGGEPDGEQPGAVVADAAEPVAGEQVDGDDGETDKHHLAHHQELGARPEEAVEGCPEIEDEVRVVTEEVEAAHGYERALPLGEQPVALVVDPEVEGDVMVPGAGR